MNTENFLTYYWIGVITFILVSFLLYYIPAIINEVIIDCMMRNNGTGIINGVDKC